MNNNLTALGYASTNVVINASYGFGDDFSIQRGSHNIKFGVNYRAMEANLHSFTNYYGGGWSGSTGTEAGELDTATGQPCTQTYTPTTCASESGSVLAGYILGEIGGYSVYAPHAFYYRWKYGAAYFQDNWRASSKLTLNLGIRWQVETPRMEKYNYQGSFIPTGTGTLNGVATTGGFAYSGTNGLPETLWAVNYKEFEPRIGFAYQPARFMTVRGAYTLVHAPLTGLGTNIVPNLSGASSASVGSNGFGGNNDNWYVNLINNPISSANLNPQAPVRSNALIETWTTSSSYSYLPYVRTRAITRPTCRFAPSGFNFSPAGGQ